MEQPRSGPCSAYPTTVLSFKGEFAQVHETRQRKYNLAYGSVYTSLGVTRAGTHGRCHIRGDGFLVASDSDRSAFAGIDLWVLVRVCIGLCPINRYTPAQEATPDRLSRYLSLADVQNDNSIGGKVSTRMCPAESVRETNQSIKGSCRYN